MPNQDETKIDHAEKLTKRALGRRGFLRGAGFTAAGATVLDGVKLAAKEASINSAVVGPGRVPVVLNINGKEHRLALEPRATLAEALRYDLGLTGTKVVCDRGACSACTVWLDKTPVNSCMTLAIDVGKRRVTTIEGLANGDDLHPVQAAFIKHDALQCGFCTPGMIMSCAALLERNPNPDLDDVKLATSGNLCRCGTYPKVFEATLEAVQVRKSAGVVSIRQGVKES
jgi:xanthine dehydrogenase YagT iron-sulfur-binding subunit